MPRYQFGGHAATWAFQLVDASAQYGAGVSLVKIAPATTVTMWTQLTGGTQLTDLQNASLAPITQIVTDSVGNFPVFYAPNDLTSMWADAGGPRVLITANNAPGVKGDQGDPGPPGPGEPPIYYNRGTSTFPARPSLPIVYLWSGPVFPAPGSAGGPVEGDFLRLEPA